MLEAINLSKQYNGAAALDSLNLKIEPGEVFCLLGANGAGKTRQNRGKYRGQWVVLDQDRLIGHTANQNEVAAIIQQARDEGVRSPFIKLIPENDEPIWMGWL